jgi:hypothetical protein
MQSTTQEAAAFPAVRLSDADAQLVIDRTTADAQAELLPYVAAVANLAAQADRALVTDEDTAERATTLRAMIKAAIAKAEDTRKARTAPLRESEKAINASWKTSVTEPLQKADTKLGAELTRFLTAKAQREEEERRALAAKREQDALERAAAAEAAGEVERADQIVDTAANLVPAARGAKPTKTRGFAGGTSYLVTRWTFEVTAFERVERRFLVVDGALVRAYIEEARATATAQAGDLKGQAKEGRILEIMAEILAKVPGIKFERSSQAATR